MVFQSGTGLIRHRTIVKECGITQRSGSNGMTLIFVWVMQHQENITVSGVMLYELKACICYAANDVCFFSFCLFCFALLKCIQITRILHV